MEESRILNRGQSILLPYKDDMQMKISSEGADDFDIVSLNNNRTDKYLNCINITKYLSKGHLKLRVIKASTSMITIDYQGNVGKGTLTIGDETFDIFLSDTKISISIDENLCSDIHFISNETIDEDKKECQSDEIINNLELIKQQLEQTEQLLKEFVENRQRMVEQIRAQIKPK